MPTYKTTQMLTVNQQLEQFCNALLKSKPLHELKKSSEELISELREKTKGKDHQHYHAFIQLLNNITDNVELTTGSLKRQSNQLKAAISKINTMILFTKGNLNFIFASAHEKLADAIFDYLQIIIKSTQLPHVIVNKNNEFLNEGEALFEEMLNLYEQSKKLYNNIHKQHKVAEMEASAKNANYAMGIFNAVAHEADLLPTTRIKQENKNNKQNFKENAQKYFSQARVLCTHAKSVKAKNLKDMSRPQLSLHIDNLIMLADIYYELANLNDGEQKRDYLALSKKEYNLAQKADRYFTKDNTIQSGEIFCGRFSDVMLSQRIEDINRQSHKRKSNTETTKGKRKKIKLDAECNLNKNIQVEIKTENKNPEPNNVASQNEIKHRGLNQWFCARFQYSEDLINKSKPLSSIHLLTLIYKKLISSQSQRLLATYNPIFIRCMGRSLENFLQKAIAKPCLSPTSKEKHIRIIEEVMGFFNANEALLPECHRQHFVGKINNYLEAIEARFKYNPRGMKFIKVECNKRDNYYQGEANVRFFSVDDYLHFDDIFDDLANNTCNDEGLRLFFGQGI